jgi:hypothetical protein
MINSQLLINNQIIDIKHMLTFEPIKSERLVSTLDLAHGVKFKVRVFLELIEVFVVGGEI